MVEKITDKNLQTIPTITHGFFNRTGGVSDGIYNSLNCALGSNDNINNALENRNRVARALDQNNISTLYQIHSNKPVVIDEPLSPKNRPEADALITTTPGVAIGVLTADCVPILASDETGTMIAAIHAGWKGTQMGIIQNTIQQMKKMGAKNITAAIGPALQQQSYEVGPEFPAHFPDHPQFFTSVKKTGHFLFDLPGLVQHIITPLVASVTNLQIDTYPEKNNFFSYRRTTHAKEPDYGRNIAAICIK